MTIDIDAKRKQLGILIGTWDTVITPLGDDAGGSTTATDSYRWSANGVFVEHDVDATMGDGQIRSLEIIAIDPKTGQYTTRSYDPDGSMSDFVAELDGNEWRLTGEQQRFSGTFSAGGTQLDGEWKQRNGTKWSPIMNVSLRKRPTASS